MISLKYLGEKGRQNIQLHLSGMVINDNTACPEDRRKPVYMGVVQWSGYCLGFSRVYPKVSCQWRAATCLRATQKWLGVATCIASESLSTSAPRTHIWQKNFLMYKDFCQWKPVNKLSSHVQRAAPYPWVPSCKEQVAAWAWILKPKVITAPLYSIQILKKLVKAVFHKGDGSLLPTHTLWLPDRVNEVCVWLCGVYSPGLPVTVVTITSPPLLVT